jgi:hypothetical protein
MACFVVFPGLVVLVIANYYIVRRLMFMRARAGPWILLIAIWILGAAFGIYGGFFLEYQVTPRVRVAGAPVPAVYFFREGPPGDPRYTARGHAPLLFAASNVVIVPAVLAMPFGFIYWVITMDAKSRLEAAPTSNEEEEWFTDPR